MSLAPESTTSPDPANLPDGDTKGGYQAGDVAGLLAGDGNGPDGFAPQAVQADLVPDELQDADSELLHATNFGLVKEFTSDHGCKDYIGVV